MFWRLAFCISCALWFVSEVVNFLYFCYLMYNHSCRVLPFILNESWHFVLSLFCTSAVFGTLLWSQFNNPVLCFILLPKVIQQNNMFILIYWSADALSVFTPYSLSLSWTNRTAVSFYRGSCRMLPFFSCSLRSIKQSAPPGNVVEITAMKALILPLLPFPPMTAEL